MVVRQITDAQTTIALQILAALSMSYLFQNVQVIHCTVVYEQFTLLSIAAIVEIRHKLLSKIDFQQVELQQLMIIYNT